jgi:hypothetical protein
MDNTFLIKYIFKDGRNRITDILESWIGTCDKYKEFVLIYRDKIRKKILEATNDEVLNDVMFELEVAYLLCLDTRCEVEYEKYKKANTRSPDFIISFDNSTSFAMEVKRIRESIAAVRYQSLIQEIADEVQKVPSSLGFSLVNDDLDATQEIVEILESEKDALIRYIKSAIQNEESRISSGSVRKCPLPGFGDKFVLILTKPLKKINAAETSYNGGFRPSFYTQREYLKFSDAIFEKLGQMRPNMVNVLVITSDSTTHESEDLYQAIHFINQFVNNKDDAFFSAKGFQGTAGFMAFWKRLSGIVFRTIWISISNRTDRNTLWQNVQAEQHIPEAVAEYFRKMDKARAIA